MSLDPKYKEMVALGAAIGANCIPCLEWHYAKCMELGFTPEEMQAAIHMAKAVKKAPAEKIDETAKLLLAGEQGN